VTALDQDCPRSAAAKAGLANRSGEHRLGWLAVSPALLLLIGLLFGPIAAVVLFSLTDWQLGSFTFHFIGTANFRTLFTDPTFWKALSNTLVYAAIVVPGTVLLCLRRGSAHRGQSRPAWFYGAAHFLPVCPPCRPWRSYGAPCCNPTIGLVKPRPGRDGNFRSELAQGRAYGRYSLSP